MFGRVAEGGCGVVGRRVAAGAFGSGASGSRAARPGTKVDRTRTLF